MASVSYCLLMSALLVALTLPKEAVTLSCYTCQGEDNLCVVGLLGQKVDCALNVKHCYKSWTVETTPETKRKCGSDKDLPNKCTDVLHGANLMLACYCNHTDYCNSGTSLRASLTAMLLLSAAVHRSLLSHSCRR